MIFFFISKKSTAIGSAHTYNFLDIFGKITMTESSANFLSPKSNGQGFSFLILSPHHPKNVVKSFMHKIKGTEDKVDQYVTF